jgi:hypothetical protein
VKRAGVLHLEDGMTTFRLAGAKVSSIILSRDVDEVRCSIATENFGWLAREVTARAGFDSGLAAVA